MKISYNHEIDAVYIRLIEGKHERRTVRLNEEIALNIGKGETLVGIEILDAREVLCTAGSQGAQESLEKSNVCDVSQVTDIPFQAGLYVTGLPQTKVAQGVAYYLRVETWQDFLPNVQGRIGFCYYGRLACFPREWFLRVMVNITSG